jgi:putative ABC transport system permease protein
MSSIGKKASAPWALRVIAFIGVIVPRRLRADWRQEWEAELRYREMLLAEWNRLDWRTKLDLLRRSLSAFWDALMLQPRRLEDEMFQDLRYGGRMLLRQRTFTLAAIIALALGIGANTAVFSVVNAVLLRPLPYRDADGLVMIWGNLFKLGMERMGARAAEYHEYRQQTRVFAETAAFDNLSFNFTESGSDPERIAGARVTVSLFPLLGAQTVAGQLFTSDQEQVGSDQVVIVSHGLWQRRFGGDPNLIGKTISLDGRSRTVVGILHAGFQFPHQSFPFAKPADLFVPLTFTPEQIAQRSGRFENYVLARLRPGVTLEQARAQMSLFAQTIEQYYRGPNNADGGWRITVEPLQQVVVGRSRQMLLALLAMVGLVLLIACANVANLLLARAVVRQKEIAVRLALGASRLRIVRQLLTESVLLAVLGGGLGLLLARWGIKALVRLDPDSLPRVGEISIDGSVLAFTVATSMLTGLLFGIMPALQASRPTLSLTLKDAGPGLIGGWRRFQFRHLLLVAEVALTLVVLVCAGLVINSFVRLLRVNPGLNPNEVLTVGISLSPTKYADRLQIAAFYDQLLVKVGTLPGVQSVGASSIVPLSGRAIEDPFSIEGRPLDPNRLTVAGHQNVTPELFRTLGIPLVQGRDFNSGDTADAPPVAIINETMARTYWPDQNPIGQRIKLGAPNAPGNWMAIIGIVRDIPHRGLDSLPEPDWYWPQSQLPNRTMTLFVRGPIDPASLAAAIRRQVQAIDPAQPVAGFGSMNEVISSSIAPRRFTMLLLTIFAAVALLLAATGVYGVMAYALAQRTREVGIRMALGAQAGDVIRLILKQGLTLTLAGIAAGIAGAIAAARAMSGLLYGVSATDPVTFVTISLLLLAVALLACYLPARRAAKVDPVNALRNE